MPLAGQDFKIPQTVFEAWTFFKSPVFIQPLQLPTYTVATLPTAADFAGCIVYVSDGAAGAVFRGSNGTSWVSLG